jgi:hypothetical protein
VTSDSRHVAVLAVAAFALAALGMLAILLWPSGRETAPAAAGAPPAATTAGSPAEPARTIKARLFYVADDGMKLTSVERDVPFGEGLEQARAIVATQIAPVEPPLVSAVPGGTSLRDLFVTESGDAYVDLSREAAAAHPGGTVNELLTVYTVVHALTVNLPGIKAVQILIDGREVPTLAGHVDLRQPLAPNLALVQ